MNFQPGDRVEVIAARGFCDCHVGNQYLVLSVEPPEPCVYKCVTCAHQSGFVLDSTAFLMNGDATEAYAFQQLRKLPPLVDEIEELRQEIEDEARRLEKELDRVFGNE